MSVDDDIRARNRLLIYTVARMGGLAIFFLGIAIVYTNLVKPGGSPQLGAIIAILGVIDAMFAPRVLKMVWDRKDEQEPR